MWKMQEAERDFSDDIQEAHRVYLFCVRVSLIWYRREETIDTINEVMDEIRAEIYDES
jgi:hypothetical protein